MPENDGYTLPEVTEKQLLCPHMNFACQTNVIRLTDVEGGPVTSYTAEIVIRCDNCGLPFSFLGLPCGSLYDGAATSADGTEARMAITPGVGGLFAIPSEGNSERISFKITKGTTGNE